MKNTNHELNKKHNFGHFVGIIHRRVVSPKISTFFRVKIKFDFAYIKKFEVLTNTFKNLKIMIDCEAFFLLQVVGKWFNSLQMNLGELVWNHGTTIPPSSACSLPCEVGMIKKQQVK